MAALVPPSVPIASGPPKRGRGREYLLFFNSAIITTIVAAVSAQAVPFFQTEWPNPQRKSKQQPTETPNLLLTTLAPAEEEEVVVQTPFHQDDWANPIRKAVRDYSYYQTHNEIPSNVDVQGSVFPPFQPALPENVLREAWRDYGWTQTPFEIPQVVSEVVQRPFVQTEWINPAVREFGGFSWTQNLLESTLAPVAAEVPVVQNPFAQTDWLNPLRARWIDGTWVQTPQSIPQIVEVQNPFSPPEIQNPVLRTVIRDYTWTQNALQTTLAPVFVSTEKPFHQDDWPNPLRPWIRDLTWTQTPFTILPVIAGPKPFNLQDWPNPEDSRPLFRDLTWTQTPSIGSFVNAATPPAPFSLTEHPNPIKPWVRDFTWVQSAYIERYPLEPVVVPPAPPVPEAGPRPSGGHHPWFKKIKRRLQPWEIEEIQRVINEIALRQVQTLELDQQKRFEELSRELQLKEIEWDATYLEILNEERETLIHEEIGRLLRKKITDEEDELLMLLAASL